MKKTKNNSRSGTRWLPSKGLFLVFALYHGQDYKGQSTSYDQNTANYSPTFGISCTDCTGFGAGTCVLTPAGTSGNTAVGTGGLVVNTTGEFNTAIGNWALQSNINGNNNTGVGYRTLYNNNAGGGAGIGLNNTAIGSSCLFNNISGNSNTGSGFESLYKNIWGDGNTAFGNLSLHELQGNASNPGNYNTVGGFAAGYLITDGDENTALGYYAGLGGRDGNYNTAIGAFSQVSALNSPGTGSDNNTSAGFAALQGTNTVSSTNNNIALGGSCFVNCANASNNTAAGVKALFKLDSGIGNIAFGNNASEVGQSMNYNVVFGKGAMNANYGSNNAVVGWGSMNNAIGSNNNVVIGHQANTSIIYGDNNTCIGAASNVAGNYYNSTAIGYGATVSDGNRVRIGNSAVTNIDCAVNYSGPSDQRFKFNITNEVPGVDFINSLKTVTYKFNPKLMEAHIYSTSPDSVKNARVKNIRDLVERGRESGFIAQEVKASVEKSGIDFNIVKEPSNENDYYALSYGLMVVPLTKAVQEQDKLIKALKVKNDELKSKKHNLPYASTKGEVFFDAASETAWIEIDKNAKCNEIVFCEGNVFSNLILYNLQGKELRNVSNDEKINSFDFNQVGEGMYYFAVVKDGRVINVLNVILE